MFSDLNIFKISNAMAVHAGQRQAVVAENIANVDTPDYKARDIVDFASTYRISSMEMRSTRSGHVGHVDNPAPRWQPEELRAPTDPNGNSVSLETEMMRATEVERAHSRALAIYDASMGILRATLTT